MRYDSDHKARTRARMLEEAAIALRLAGPDGLSVAALMARLGLTHGGFYAHFETKEDLVAEAVSRMFADSDGLFRSCTEGRAAAAGMARYIDAYLSETHRDAPGQGCPLPALSGELARMPLSARERFAAGAAHLAGEIAGQLERMGIAEPGRTALSMLAEMVGALALARAVPDAGQSGQALAASRDALKARLGCGP